DAGALRRAREDVQQLRRQLIQRNGDWNKACREVERLTRLLTVFPAGLEYSLQDAANAWDWLSKHRDRRARIAAMELARLFGGGRGYASILAQDRRDEDPDTGKKDDVGTCNDDRSKDA